MLHAGCGNCGAVVPLYCTGQFMPHLPLYAEAGPMGIFCRCCGPKQPIFTCTMCGMTQVLYLPGALGPIVEQLLMNAGKSFVSEFASHMGGQLGDQFGQTASNYMSSWFGNDGGWPGNGQAW